MKKTIARIGVAALLAAGTALPVATTSADAAPVKYKNCTALNKKWAHGVGRNDAKDKTSGTPVTNFFHSTKQYKKAMNNNRGLDRDKDGIACEK